MSCFIMNHDSIRKIGYTLAAILDECKASNLASIATKAAYAADLPKTFQRYYSSIRGHNGEGISEDLHAVNATAYAGRYWGETVSPFAPPSSTWHNLKQPPQYEDATERPQEWHYHLLSLLNCWLYQTDERFASDDPLRLCLQSFADELSRQIVQHSEQYAHYRWGE